MSKIKKALQKWVYGEEIEDPFRAQIGEMLPLYEPPRYGINGFTHNGRIASTEQIKKQEVNEMKREQIEKNHAKLKQLTDYEFLKEELLEVRQGWWRVSTYNSNGRLIADEESRRRFLLWLESEINILKRDLELEEES